MLKIIAIAMLAASGVFTLASRQQPQQASDEAATIARTLDAFHAAASKSDFTGYFGLFAPDGVFLGTDASERWTLDEFKAFAKPYFDQGKGWTYKPVAGKRHIAIDTGGTLAWFDELLENTKYGTCRGSGVLRKMGSEWKIVQYNLTFTVPNEVANDVVALIKTKRS